MTGNDIQQIHDVIQRYATAIDTKRWELFRSVFTEDCRMDAGNQGVIEGLDALTTHMERLHAPLDASLHRLTNITVEVFDDAAHASTYLDALLVRRDHPDGPTFQVAGRYEDALRRSESTWRISHRRFTAIWRVGNLGLIAPSA